MWNIRAGRSSGGKMTLRDAIDREQFYLDGVSYSDNDLKAMSIQKLETMKLLITKKLQGLYLALKENQTDENNPFTKDLINKQKRAKYFNENVLIYVNTLIKCQRSQKLSLAEYFMEHAKEILPPVLYEQVMHEAQESAKGDQHEQELQS
jgi:hypothetical protein